MRLIIKNSPKFFEQWKTELEDMRLKSLVDKYEGNPNWPEIASQMPGKCRENCQAYWEHRLHNNTRIKDRLTELKGNVEHFDYQRHFGYPA